MMKTIGITGGVGAGKSKILAYIQTHCNCRILLADEAAHKVREPGNPCYNALVRLLGTDTLEEDGQINRQKMAAKIFADHKLLEAINAVIHPRSKPIFCRRSKPNAKLEKSMPFLWKRRS